MQLQLHGKNPVENSTFEHKDRFNRRIYCCSTTSSSQNIHFLSLRFSWSWCQISWTVAVWFETTCRHLPKRPLGDSAIFAVENAVFNLMPGSYRHMDPVRHNVVTTLSQCPDHDIVPLARLQNANLNYLFSPISSRGSNQVGYVWTWQITRSIFINIYIYRNNTRAIKDIPVPLQRWGGCNHPTPNWAYLDDGVPYLFSWGIPIACHQCCQILTIDDMFSGSAVFRGRSRWLLHSWLIKDSLRDDSRDLQCGISTKRWFFCLTWTDKYHMS